MILGSIVESLAGAGAAALLGIIGLVIRRMIYGKAEDEERATKAAHQAVEAVEDALEQLRKERIENREFIKEQITRISELEKTVRELNARILELELPNRPGARAPSGSEPPTGGRRA